MFFFSNFSLYCSKMIILKNDYIIILSNMQMMQQSLECYSTIPSSFDSFTLFFFQSLFHNPLFNVFKWVMFTRQIYSILLAARDQDTNPHSWSKQTIISKLCSCCERTAKERVCVSYLCQIVSPNLALENWSNHVDSKTVSKCKKCISIFHAIFILK